MENGSAAAQPTVAFGVGCFHFRWNRQPPFTYNPQEYVAVLRKELEKIPAISELHIDSYDEENFHVEENSASLEDGSGYFPPLDMFEAVFELYIPQRIQVEILGPGAANEWKTERFRVHLRYTFHGPVAFIELVDAVDVEYPASAVRLVRVFLDREIRERTKEITFEFIGPSPFHAEFVLEPSEAVDGSPRFASSREVQRGYDAVRIKFDPDQFDDVEHAFDELLHVLSDELGFFYELHRQERRTYEEWGLIESAVSELSEQQPRVGRIRRLRNAAMRGRLIHKLNIQLARFESEELFERTRNQQMLRDMYVEGALRFLRPQLVNAVQDAPAFPAAQVARVIGFIEQRRTQSVEWLVVLLAAVVGGAAGALLTLIAQ